MEIQFWSHAEANVLFPDIFKDWCLTRWVDYRFLEILLTQERIIYGNGITFYRYMISNLIRKSIYFDSYNKILSDFNTKAIDQYELNTGSRILMKQFIEQWTML